MPHVTQAGWDDVPHISPQEKAELLKSIPPHQIDARTKGVPMLGSGAIYPVDERSIAIQPFAIPRYWPRGYGMDVGWNFTAAVWCAHDTETDIIYVYDVYKGEKAEPSIHADAIKKRGTWIPGDVDPAARQRSPKDGEQLLELYTSLGLDLSPANNAVEAGVNEVWQRMSTGRLRVFEHLHDFWQEFRIYRRNERGQIVKVHDHVMDALRYRVMNLRGMLSETHGLFGGGKPRYLGSV
jgi:hypothetical protein